MVSANVLFFLRVGELRVSTTMGLDTRRTGQTQGPLGLWSPPQRGQEGGKGAEEQTSLSLTANNAGDRRAVLDCLCPGMVLRDCGGQNRTLSASVQLTRTATEQQRQHKETKTGR